MQIPETAWTPPTEAQLAAARRLLAPWRWVTSPVFIGAERVPRDRPVLFIGNHTLLGVLDLPLLMLGIHERTGHFPRSMGDHIHFAIPGWRDAARKMGAVPGTREECRAVMRQGQSVIIFPGGGREVFKRQGEQYHLIWGNRSGFARMALESGYPIVPVASVGADDCYRILLDQNDVAATRLGRAVIARSPRSDVAFPTIVAGLGGTPIPIPQRFYFSFGDLIESGGPLAMADPALEERLPALREQVRGSLEALLAELIEVRRRDEDRALTARLIRKVSG